MNQQKGKLVKTNFGRNPFAPLLGSFPAFFDEEFGGDFETVSASNITLSEDEKNVYVEANLPGLKNEDIELTLDKETLWIKGSREEKKEDSDRKYYYKANRAFSYRVTLPVEVDHVKEPEAKFENGVIHISFTKSVKYQPKKIAINKS